MTKLSSKKEFEYDLIFSSLIGKKIKVLDSNNKNQIDLNGKIIFESANFITILTKENEEKNISKQDLIFEFKHDDKKIRLNSNSLSNSIQHRLKKLK